MKKQDLFWLLPAVFILFFATCEVPGGNVDGNQTPVAGDFIFGNLTQAKGSVIPVTVTAKNGKSPGQVGNIRYDGSITLPAAVGTYAVTFDVAAATGWNAAAGLSAGDLTILGFEAYLFVHFRETPLWDPNGEQVYFSLSKDGFAWEMVNDGQPVLKSVKGDEGVRDATITRTREGKFVIMATDLSLVHFDGKYGGSWGGINLNGSKDLVLWESDDLVHWGDQRMIPFSNAGFGCLWAPEITYDSVKGDYIVHWSSSHSSNNYGNKRIYYSRTSDFNNFSQPEMLYAKADSGVIDSALYEEDGKYYLFVKSEANPNIIILLKSDNITGPFERVSGFDPVMVKLQQELNGAYEAPTAVKTEDGPWLLFLDRFGVAENLQGYVPFVADSLENGAFTRSSDAFSFPYLFKHGTVLPITLEEYERLKTYDWPGIPVPPVTGDAPLKLHYTFDTDDSAAAIINRANPGTYNGTIQRTGADGSPGLNSFTAAGGAAVRNFYTGTSTGTSTSNSPAYIDMGSSASTIVTAQPDFTIAAYVFVENNATLDGNGWFLWCMADTTAAGQTSGQYLFFRAVEARQSFSLSGWGAGSESTVRWGSTLPKGRWQHVMYRQKGNMGVIFINGKAAAFGYTTIATTQLGSLQYNWIGRPCFSADRYMSRTRYADFRIYGGAISDKQIADLGIPAKLATLNGN